MNQDPYIAGGLELAAIVFASRRIVNCYQEPVEGLQKGFRWQQPMSLQTGITRLECRDTDTTGHFLPAVEACKPYAPAIE